MKGFDKYFRELAELFTGILESTLSHISFTTHIYEIFSLALYCHYLMTLQKGHQIKKAQSNFMQAQRSHKISQDTSGT